MIVWNRENKKQAAAAAVMVIAGIITGNLAGSYVPADSLLPEKKPAVQAVNMPEETEEPIPEAETRAVRKDANAYEPSITLLNLAYYFPEGADPSDVTQSYAGKVYQSLSIKDSDWLASIYDLADIKPAKMAVRLGKPVSAAYGTYNPNDETHDPDNPETWTINTWKKVNISFVNGSGQPINGYSNVKEILSMASVYTYQKDMLDAEAFEEYANRLWKNSHSYSYSMSDVYYCDGCLDMSLEELLQEAEEEELAGELAASGNSQEYGQMSEEQLLQEDSDKETSDKEDTAKETGSSSSKPKKESESGQLEAQSSTEDTYAEPNDKIVGELPPDSLDEIPTGGTIRKSTVDPTQWDHIGPGEEPMEQPEATPGNASYDSNAGTSLEENTAAETETSIQETSVQKTEPRKTETSAGTGETIPNKKKTSSSHSAGKTSGCPGHVNLNIRIQILGLNDAEGLIEADVIGNNPENMTEGGWDGWDDYSIKMVEAIHSQDWYQDYGLSISTINMRNPLSASEIDAYMDKLPAGTSKKRKEIIQFALSSVGKVPYYWGGKASRSGYEGNFFGTPVEPDTKGRILKGLDCSGWINWVYWSVTGERLAGESTSSLVLCGRPIKRSELQPGDIIVKTGTGAHVVMFLGWTSNGQMQVIHESSASVNNVTVKTMTADWPYYRNLID